MFDAIKSRVFELSNGGIIQSKSGDRQGGQRHARVIHRLDAPFLVPETAGCPSAAGMIGDGRFDMHALATKASQEVDKKIGLTAGKVSRSSDIQPERAALMSGHAPINRYKGRVALAPCRTCLEKLQVLFGRADMEVKAGNKLFSLCALHARNKSGSFGKRTDRHERTGLALIKACCTRYPSGRSAS